MEVGGSASPGGPQPQPARARQQRREREPGRAQRGTGMPCGKRSRGSANDGAAEAARIRGRPPGGPVTRFQRLAAATVAATFLLVVHRRRRARHRLRACLPALAGLLRGPVPARPRCRLPGLDRVDPSDGRRDHRRADPGDGRARVHRPPRSARRSCGRRSPPSLLVGFQAWLGRETVRLGNTGESVTAHLAAAMALVGLLVYLLVRSSYPARLDGRRQPAVHAARRVRGRGDVRRAPLRLQRHGARRRA